MRNILLLNLILLCLTSNMSFSQVWMDFGVKGAAGSTFIINKNVWDERTSVNLLTGGNTYGAKAGFNFGMDHALNVEIMFAKYGQNMKLTQDDNEYEFKFGYTTREIPVLYRHNSSEGSYIELGASFNSIKTAYETGEISSTNPIDFYEQKYMGAIFGFGSYIVGAENLYLTAGVRFSYGFQDIISDAGGKNSSSFYPINSNNYAPPIPFSDYAGTNPLAIMFILEINYDLGYLVSASCGRRAFLLF